MYYAWYWEAKCAAIARIHKKKRKRNISIPYQAEEERERSKMFSYVHACNNNNNKLKRKPYTQQHTIWNIAKQHRVKQKTTFQNEAYRKKRAQLILFDIRMRHY